MLIIDLNLLAVVLNLVSLNCVKVKQAVNLNASFCN